MGPVEGYQVSCLGSPPVAATTWTWSSPPYWPVNAMREQSGEKRADCSSPGPAVRRVAVPPWADTVQRSPA